MEGAAVSKNKRSGVQPHGSSLCDLDDDLVAKVLMFLDPYPSVANAALTCHRLRRLATDKGRWLLVGSAPPAGSISSTAATAGGALPGRGPNGPSYPTIAAAVAASRPGDTIWLAPGAPHAARAVRVRWPLRICGGGADSTAVVSPPGEAAFDVGASAQIAGLSIESRLGPCILHRRGTLRVELCTLLCHNGGLDHLVAPIVTAAVSGAPMGTLAETEMGPSVATTAAAAVAAAAASGLEAGPRRAAAAAAAERQRQNVAAAGASAMDMDVASHSAVAHSSGDAPGPGRLAVEDTRLEGSSGAGVLCVGTGALRGVRCVRASHASWYFLEVDSRHPGRLPPGGRSLCAAAAGDVVSAPEAEGLAEAGCGDELVECGEASRGPGGCPSWRCDNWQQRQQQQQGAAAAAEVGGCDEAVLTSEQQQQEEERRRGLARINSVLGPLAISPAVLAAHLAARHAAAPSRP